MKVKICGIKTAEAAKAAASAGADFIGFIFASSSRRITPEAAASIANVLPISVKKVGVFANQSESEIASIASVARLDYIQLHGEESAEFARSLPLPVIKAFSIESNDEDLQQLADYPADYYIVDLPKKPKSGQEKRNTLDWKALASASLPFEKIILAGGLTAENVAEAIFIVQPFGVDVASGVETDGVKDEEKIGAFMTQAKQNERRSEE